MKKQKKAIFNWKLMKVLAKKLNRIYFIMILNVYINTIINYGI